MKKWLITIVCFTLMLVGCSSGNKETTTSNQKDNEVVIYLVRHGKTFFNTTGQVQGFADSPLTDVGIQQAQQVGEGLKDIVFIGAYSSSLGRQRSTAQYILQENKNTIPDIVEIDGLKEWNYGGFEGKSNAEMWTPIFEAHDLKFDEDWTDYETLVQMLGDEGIADAISSLDPLGEAESYDEIVKRGLEGLNQMIDETLAKGGGNILAVSSGGMIPTLLTLIVPEQYNGQDINNCSVTILKYKDGVYTLEVIGDTSYLK